MKPAWLRSDLLLSGQTAKEADLRRRLMMVLPSNSTSKLSDLDFELRQRQRESRELEPPAALASQRAPLGLR